MLLFRYVRVLCEKIRRLVFSWVYSHGYRVNKITSVEYIIPITQYPYNYLLSVYDNLYITYMHNSFIDNNIYHRLVSTWPGLSNGFRCLIGRALDLRTRYSIAVSIYNEGSELLFRN